MPLSQLESSQVSTTITGDGGTVEPTNLLEASRQGISVEGHTKRGTPIMSISESLKCAGHRSLGSLARNACFSNTVEVLVWPVEVLDKSECQVVSDTAVTDHQFLLSTKQ